MQPHRPESQPRLLNNPGYEAKEDQRERMVRKEECRQCQAYTFLKVQANHALQVFALRSWFRIQNCKLAQMGRVG